MKKKTLLTVLFTSLITLSACTGSKKEANETSPAATVAESNAVVSTYLNVDLDDSEINWKGFKPGGSHYGDLKLKSAELLVNPADSTIVSGKFVIDMNSIDVEDLDESQGKLKLEAHLKSDDFFAVETYPDAIFEITSSKKLNTRGLYEISGNLTIKATTLNITFNANIRKSDEREVEAKTETIVLDRTKWGVNYGSKNIYKDLKDNIIHDNIEVVAEIEATY